MNSDQDVPTNFVKYGLFTRARDRPDDPVPVRSQVYTFPDSMIDYDFARRLMGSADGKTIKDIIATMWGGTKHELSKMAIIVLRAIRRAREEKDISR